MNGKLNLKKFKLIALDTNIFIYHFQENQEFIEKTDIIFNALVENKIKAVTSIIALTELLSLKQSQIILKELEELFNTAPNLSTHTVDYAIALKSSEIRREYGFRMPDAIQLATAVRAKADIFITNDARLQKFKELKVALLPNIIRN